MKIEDFPRYLCPRCNKEFRLSLWSEKSDYGRVKRYGLLIECECDPALHEIRVQAPSEMVDNCRSDGKKSHAMAYFLGWWNCYIYHLTSEHYQMMKDAVQGHKFKEKEDAKES